MRLLIAALLHEDFGDIWFIAPDRARDAQPDRRAAMIVTGNETQSADVFNLRQFDLDSHLKTLTNRLRFHWESEH